MLLREFKTDISKVFTTCENILEVGTECNDILGQGVFVVIQSWHVFKSVSSDFLGQGVFLLLLPWQPENALKIGCNCWEVKMVFNLSIAHVFQIVTLDDTMYIEYKSNL